MSDNEKARFWKVRQNYVGACALLHQKRLFVAWLRTRSPKSQPENPRGRKLSVESTFGGVFCNYLRRIEKIFSENDGSLSGYGGSNQCKEHGEEGITREHVWKW